MKKTLRYSDYIVLLTLTCLVRKNHSQCMNFSRYVKENIAVAESQLWMAEAPNLEQCLKMCVRRSACNSMNYNLRTSLCELNNRTVNSARNKSDQALVYAEFNWLPAEIDPSCFSRPCLMDEVCIPKLSESNCSYYCMPAGRKVCPFPNAGTSSGRYVGDVNELHCGKGYIGNDSATCLPNGKWSKKIRTKCDPVTSSTSPSTSSSTVNPSSSNNSTQSSSAASPGSPPSTFTVSPLPTSAASFSTWFNPTGSITVLANTTADSTTSLSTPGSSISKTSATTFATPIMATSTVLSPTVVNTTGTNTTTAPVVTTTVTATPTTNKTPYVTTIESSSTTILSLTTNPKTTITDVYATTDVDTTTIEVSTITDIRTTTIEVPTTTNVVLTTPEYGIRLSPLDQVEYAPVFNHSGYLEMFIKGQWSYINIDDQQWTWEATKVACREINSSLIYGGTFHPKWFGEIFSPSKTRKFSKLACNQSDLSLLDCDHTFEEKISNGKPMVITCFDFDVMDGNYVYLQPVDDKDYSMLMINLTNINGGVCQTNGWEQNVEGLVACKSINPDWRQKGNSYKINSGNNVLVSNVKCSGNEPHLLYCQNEGWGRNAICNANKILAITCG